MLAGKTLIINYHYCLVAAQGSEGGLRGITAEFFGSQLDFLHQTCQPAVWASAHTAPAPDASVLHYLLTFDDGHRDAYHLARPHIKRIGAPTIFFCCSQPYLEGRVLNVQKTHLLTGKWGWRAFRSKFNAALNKLSPSWTPEDSTHLGLARMYRYDDEETAGFKRMLNVELPYSLLSRVLDDLFEAEFGSQKEAVRHLYMSIDDLLRTVDDGIQVGLHTHSHPMLSRLSPEEQASEIDLGLDFFRSILGQEIRTISYPYGILGSWNQVTKDLLTIRHISTGFTLGRQIYDPGAQNDPLEIPRFDVNDIFNSDATIRQEFLP